MEKSRRWIRNTAATVLILSLCFGASVLLVNYAFTFPYFAFNFLIRSHFYSAVVMAIIAVLTSALTTIYGSCTTIRENGDQLIEQQKDNMLRGIQEDSQWLVRMVENLLSGATLGGNCTPIGASANITGIGILRKEGYEVKNNDFFKIGIPFTLAAIIPAYIYLWLFFGA